MRENLFKYLTFILVILIITEIQKKEEVMKKVFLMLAVLLIVLPLSARPKLEFSPRGTVYIGGAPGADVSFGIAGDLIVNPKKQFGIRVNLAELAFGDIEGIAINSSLTVISPTTFDVLYYTNVANLFSYIVFTFGYSSVNDIDAFAIGGGLGLEKYMGKGNYLFFEPGLVFIDTGFGDGELMIKLPFGFKLGI